MKLDFKQKAGIAAYMVRSLLTKPRFSLYNPRSPAFLQDPYPAYLRMQQDKQLFWSPHTLGWHLSGGHEFLTPFLRDERLTHSFRYWMFAPNSKAHSELDALLDNLLMSLSVKDHMRVRKMVSPAFSPRFVVVAKPAIEEMVGRLLHEQDHDGVIDMVKLCREIPINAMAIYFCIPDGMRSDFSTLGHAILASFDSATQPDVAGAERGIAQLRALFAEKRAHPDDTFMSTLVNHMEDGERISENEALALVGSLLAAGVDTTFDYMLNIFFGLVKNPQWGPWLKEHPDRVQDFIDETFRWNNFGTRGFYRFAVEDLVILGQKIKRGEIVQVMMATANHDPAIFPKPETFDPTRNNLDKALSFGVGAHYCLGHAIAKLIAQTTTLAVINRYPHLSVTQEPQREYNMTSRRMRTFIVNGAEC
jgi:cytochrome P450 enzyme